MIRKVLFLPKDEYAKVISELNTHLSEEEREKLIIVKPIGEYYYTVINRGFNDYLVIGKRKIDYDLEGTWEDVDEK